MKNVICAWCKSNSEEFEKIVPLKFVASRNRALGFSNQIEILFLDGFERLDDIYKDSLKELGFNLHDCSNIFSSLDKKYPDLERFGDYEKKCFLRWLVIHQYFRGEAIIHYDGDIIFNEDPSILQKKMQNTTFILQGCPAITCVNDQDWFNQYQSQLDIFASQIEEYSERAWIEKEGCSLSEENKWSGSRYRKIISSDQDLFSHLIHTDRIIQSNPQEIISRFSSDIFIQNPLYFHVYSPWNKNMPFKYERKSGIDFFGEKQIAVWHMQGYFVKYLSEYMNFRRFLGLLSITIPNDIEENFEWKESGVWYKLRKRIVNSRFYRDYSRQEVCNFFFNEQDFSPVFNNKIWWKKGVFY